jgi:hypothetical protein
MVKEPKVQLKVGELYEITSGGLKEIIEIVSIHTDIERISSLLNTTWNSQTTACIYHTKHIAGDVIHDPDRNTRFDYFSDNSRLADSAIPLTPIKKLQYEFKEKVNESNMNTFFEPLYEEIQPQFEVGKYYSFNWVGFNNLFIVAKVSGVDNNNIIVSFNNREGKYYQTDGFFYSDMANIKELSLENVQQYLPDGHEDKIKKDVDEFKAGDYVVVLDDDKSKCATLNYCYKITKVENNYNYAPLYAIGKERKLRYATPEEIAEYNRLGKPFDVTTLNNKLIEGEYYYHLEARNILIWGKNGTAPYYFTDYSTGFSKNGGNFTNQINKYRLATPEEKQWLDACIEQNKFIPKDEALKPTKTKYEVVHCTTQEEWDFVLSKNSDSICAKYATEYTKDICFVYGFHNYGTQSDLDWFKQNNSLIYSFQAWCDKFRHKPDFIKKPNMEDLITEAKRRYPVGTIFKCLHKCQGGPIIKEDHTFNSDDRCIRVLNGCGCIYEDGKWAEIIETPKEEVLTFEQFGIDPNKEYDVGIINSWQNQGINRYDEKWIQQEGVAGGNRKLVKIEFKEGIPALHISGTLDLWIKAEGFIDYYNSEMGITKNPKEELPKVKVGDWITIMNDKIFPQTNNKTFRINEIAASSRNLVKIDNGISEQRLVFVDNKEARISTFKELNPYPYNNPYNLEQLTSNQSFKTPIKQTRIKTELIPVKELKINFKN